MRVVIKTRHKDVPSLEYVYPYDDKSLALFKHFCNGTMFIEHTPANWDALVALAQLHGVAVELIPA